MKTGKLLSNKASAEVWQFVFSSLVWHAMCRRGRAVYQHDLVRHLCAARDSHNISVYPDLVRHLCVARDSNIGSKQKRLPRPCSTSMCCERFKHWPPTPAFTPILFNIYALREIQTLAPSRSVYPDLNSTSMCCERFNQTLAPNSSLLFCATGLVLCGHAAAARSRRFLVRPVP